MNLLRFRGTENALAAVYGSADIARLTGLSRGRITQLRSADETVPLPEPDAADSTDARPLWRGITVARWCAASGRRLPARTASWLLPGPDGPRLQRAEQRTVTLHQKDDVLADLQRPPIDVHVTQYTADGFTGRGPSVWLATVMAPGESARLVGWPPHWENGSPLQNLVHELLDDRELRPASGEGLLGTLVVIPTENDPRYGIGTGFVRVLDLYQPDAEHSGKDLHDRLRQLPVQAAEMADLAGAIGHRLPWWPPGCATPPLVSAWDPQTSRTETIPPPLADAYAFQRRCAATADQLEGTLAASVRELGDTRWGQASNDWRPGYEPDLGVLPKECDSEVWQVAVRFGLSNQRPSGNGDFWEGLRWLMEHAPSMHLARDAHRTFGDPESAATVIIDTALLPAAAATQLTGGAVTPANAGGSYRAQRVLDTLDAHPGSAAGAALGTWPALAGPAWCATAPGTTLIALHVPRSLPAPGPESFLEAVVLRAVRAGDHYADAPALVLVLTHRDNLVVLPECGGAARLAAVIEHTVWHPGTGVHTVGLVPSSNKRLIETVDSLLDATARTTPWEQLTDLVGPHAAGPSCIYC
ncbi:hypothetical protein OG357_38620 (plasmid) [Streptomyces sp. NBC_01255]|uniref:hypothetical protein n=1 Tax=Streptomyces sp. NBC_01255 TaxID=2903798 RepID=UPI002E2FD1B8|nr:hypothetical protein [Streptomyces sp. NBC_01255]